MPVFLELPAIFLSMRHPEALANRRLPPQKGLLLGLVLNKKSKPRAEKLGNQAFSAKMTARETDERIQSLLIRLIRCDLLNSMV